MICNGERSRMEAGFTIDISDTNDDYLDADIHVWNARFSGRTHTYVGNTALTQLAEIIDGFPASVPDERQYEFGTRDRKYAGGYCGLRFYTVDSVGHAALDVDIVDDPGWYAANHIVKLTIPVVAADIDRFIKALYALEVRRHGSITLGETGDS